MKRMARKFIAIFGMFLIIVSAFPLSAYASAGVSVSASKTTVTVGDTVTVNISFTGSRTIGAIDGSYSYNSGILTYSSDTFGGGGTGKLVLTSSSASITFKAVKAGTTTVSVTGSVYALEPDAEGDDLLGTANGSVSITVKDPAPDPEPTTPSKPTTPTKPSTPTTTVEPEPEPDPMENAIEVTVLGEKAYLWPDLSDVELPEGFELGNTTYQEQDIQVATRMQVSLAYLTDEEGENGTFWNYNVDTQEFYSFVEFTTQGSYVFLQADEELTAPEGYSPTSVEINGEMLQGWIADDNQLQDFILLYATNNKGEEGFYLYDLEEGTMQRFGQRIVEVEVEIEPEPRSVVQRIFDDPVIAGILSALGLIVAGLAVSFARVVQKNKKNDSE